MVDRLAMVDKLIHSHEDVQALLKELEPKREIYPEWTVKEFVAHLAGWDDACIASIQAHLRGQEPGTPAERGIDYYNAQSVLERKDLTLEQVTREMNLARDTFIQLIREMPEEKLQARFILPWAEYGTVHDLEEIFSEHEEEHVQEIRANIQGQQ